MSAIQEECTVHGNMTLIVPPHTDAYRSFASGQYEREVISRLPSLVLNGMSAVDLGANVGYFTLLMSRLVAPTGSIYAFEPDPDIFVVLAQNVRNNGCSNTTLESFAVSDITGSATFIQARMRMGGFLAKRQDAHALGEPINVRSITLDDYFCGLGWPKVDIVKMDLEGGELAALRGMKGLVRRNPHLELIMEINQVGLATSNSSMQQISEALLDLGFVRGRIFEDDLREFHVARLPVPGSVVNALLTRT